jgi:diacylglycerol O-acyltransferase / wax synthase
MSESRLTTLDASFLEVESESAHMHVGWAARFRTSREGSAPTFAQLRDHVAGHLGRAPRYRQKLAGVPLDLNDPVWVDDEAFDIDRHVRHSRSRSLDALTDEVLSRQLARDRPLWELWIADNLPDGSIGVVGKAHHAMADGIAAVELATLLLDPTPEPPPPMDDDWRPAPRPGGAELLADGILDRARTTLGLAGGSLTLARDPRRLLRFAGDGLQSALALADSLRPAERETGLNEPISSRRHLARARRPLGDLRRVKREFGATINDVVLAVASGGVRRFLRRRGEEPVPLKAMVPVSVRPEDGAGALGNQISFVFVDLPCDEPDPVARLLDVKEEVGERKRSGRPEGASRALKAFAYTPRLVQRALSHLAASPRTFNFVVSNIPGPREPLYMLGCELEEVYPVVPIADGHAFSIGVTTVRDEAFFGIYADPETLPDADHLAECLDEALEELLAAGGVNGDG